MVTKFSPQGKVLMVIGRRPPAVDGPVIAPAGPNAPAQKYILCRPTDVGWDPQGNIFVSDGYCNNRVVKYDKNGRFIAQAGSEKAGTGSASSICRTGCRWTSTATSGWRIAPTTGTRCSTTISSRSRKSPISASGWTLCISPGPHQYVFLSNSNPNGNPPGSWDNTGEIYKMELDGTMLGKFGKPGKNAPGFQVVHMMDCRNPNEIVVGEIESWRVQKYILKPSPSRPSAGR